MKQYLTHFINRPTMRKHLGLLFIGLVLGMLTFAFINFEDAQNLGLIFMSGLLGVLIAYAVSYFNETLNRLLDWKNTGVRLLLGTISNSILAFGITWLGAWGKTWMTSGTFNGQVFEVETVLKLAILIFCGALIYNIVYFAFYSYNHYSKIQLLELKTERKQAELQLATLKSQLSPHFLFNCINSLSVLFHDHTEKAEVFIRSMAKSYQYTLEHHRESLVSLGEELEFVKSYVFLMKTRFGEAFDLTLDIEEQHLKTKIPPLTLQLLVENAVNHNLVQTTHPIKVQISSRQNSLVVLNNKVPKKPSKPSTGIGLKNIADRYGLLSKAKIEIENTQNFKVTLPILNHE